MDPYKSLLPSKDTASSGVRTKETAKPVVSERQKQGSGQSLKELCYYTYINPPDR